MLKQSDEPKGSVMLPIRRSQVRRALEGDKTMKRIADAIIKELRGTDPTLDTIKAYVRVAMATAEMCGSPLTVEEGTEVVRMCVVGCSTFDPLA